MVTHRRGWNGKKKDGWALKTLTHRAQNLCLKITCRSKFILDGQPLRVEGRLPNWLCTEKGLIAFDVFDGNLCVSMFSSTP